MDIEIQLEDRENLIQSDEYDFQISKEELLSICEKSPLLTTISKLERHGGIIGLFDKLRVNPNMGLNEEKDSLDLVARRRIFGKNDPVIPKLPSFFSCLVEIMNDNMVLFLIFFGLISFILDILENKYIWFEYSSIYISVIIIVIVLGLNDYSKDKMLIDFQIELENKDVRVLRSKKEINIPKKMIVVGDILIVSSGDVVPVDGILIKSHNILYEYQNKWCKHYNIHYKHTNLDDIPLIYSGSNILKGYGIILVLAVGVNTVDAKIKMIRFNNRKKADSSEESYISIEKKNYLSSNFKNANFNTNYSDEVSEVDKVKEKLNSDPENQTKFPNEPNDNISQEDIEEKIIKKQNNKKKLKEISPLPIISEVIKLNKSSHKSTSNLYSKSSFKESLEKLSIFLVKIGCIVSLASTLVILIRLYLSYSFTIFLSHIPDSILYGLLIIVILTSKGLPLTLNMCLNSLIKKMKEQNTIIRNISACAAMACANIICTDYSKILTHGEMSVSSFYIEDRLLDETSSYKFRDISEDSFEFFCEAISINSTAYLSEKATSNIKEGVKEIFQQKKFFGDKIDSALLSYLKSLNIDYMKYRNNIDRQVIDRSDYDLNKKIQYSIINMEDKVDYVRIYVRGSPCVLLKKLKNYISYDAQLNEINLEKYQELKSICKESLCNGLIPILICYRDIYKDHYYNHKKIYLKENEEEYERFIIKDLTLISLMRLREEIKPNVDEVIKELQNYGVNIKLITSFEKEIAYYVGDTLKILKEDKIENKQIIEEKQMNYLINKEKNEIDEKQSDNKALSRVSLLKEKYKRSYLEKKYKTITDYNTILNNLNNKKTVLDTIQDIRKYIDPEVFRVYSKTTMNIDIKILDYLKLSKTLENSEIISRAGELEKFIYVALLRQKGDIVINLGEGVDDALAMSNSNISITMWPNSSDICREMADIIIMDGNIKSISSTIINSRNLFLSVRKYLQYQLTAIFVFLITLFFCSLINFNIYPSQVLWFNLIVNTFGPFAFSMEQPKEKTLSHKRFSLDIKIINKNMVLFILIQVIVQCTILFLIIIKGDYIFNVKSDVGLSFKGWGPENGHHTTLVFSVLIFLQIFSAFVSRNLGKKINVFSDLNYNIYFPVVQLFIIFLHVLLISLGSSYIKVLKISYYNLIKCLIISSVILLTPFILNFLIVEEKIVKPTQETLHRSTTITTIRRKKSDYGLRII